ncbi:conjugal transfer protein TraF [Pediococcus stilesii]|uniref:conjugal transfer protein TraF n=1 Tax=Pediococcus stilesii TaxID=331679 RepID=UPI0014874E06|nr:conjugal transfer protein TraF [Pediococcus stilesii]
MIKKLLVTLGVALGMVMFGATNMSTVEAQTTVPVEQETNITEEQYLSNVANLTPINGETLFEKLDSNEQFYLYVGYKECEYCRAFSPVLSKLSNDTSIPIYYFDLDQSFTPEMIEKVMDYLQNKLQMTGTPTVAYYNNGSLSKTFAGSNVTEQELLEAAS